MDTSEYLPQRIAAWAEREPEVVVIQETDGRTATAAQLLDSCLRWTHAFERIGVREGDTVASILPNILEAYYHWLGLAWLPAIDVPINEQYGGGQLIHALGTAGASVLVTVRAYLGPVLEVLDSVERLTTIVVADGIPESAPHSRIKFLDLEQFLSGASATERKGPTANDPFGVIYTSGTTGPSKGVLGRWPQLASALAGTFPGDEFGQFVGGAYYSPWRSCHLTSKTALDFSVRLGIRLVLRDVFSVSRFWDDIRTYGCTHALLAFIAPWLAAEPERADDAENPLRHVSMVPLMPEFREFSRRFDVRVSTAWASSEAGWPLSESEPVDPRACGKVVPGYQVQIARPDGSVADAGETGELLVRHDDPERLFIGYLGMPQATAEVLRGGWYHTGDGFVTDDDGNYYFVERLKDYIKYRGQNISAAEVEAHVQEHPEVFECACVGIPSEGGPSDVIGDEEVKIVVVPTAGSSLTPERLLAHLVGRMPRFMVPRYVEFTDALPRNHVNKVVKGELRKDPINVATWDRVAAGITLPRNADAHRNPFAANAPSAAVATGRSD